MTVSQGQTVVSGRMVVINGIDTLSVYPPFSSQEGMISIHMDTYRCWCEFCDFRKRAENLEGVVNITDRHRTEHGHRHFVEFERVKQKQSLD